LPSCTSEKLRHKNNFILSKIKKTEEKTKSEKTKKINKKNQAYKEEKEISKSTKQSIKNGCRK